VKPGAQRSKGQPGQARSASLGAYQAGVEAALNEMAGQRLVARIWEHDHTVWKPEPTEIANRLGWLHIAEAMSAEVASLTAWRDAVVAGGHTDVLLLGMGGSSLAPDVYSRVFGSADGPLRLAVLDSTDPGVVLAQAERLDPARTLFIVATKSGSTAETLSFFKFFYNWTLDALGQERVGGHFVAITDPGSKLADLAQRSYFGLVPAVLAGVDIGTLLARAREMARRCRPDTVEKDNDAAWLGAVLAELTLAGRDKLTLVVSPGLANFGDWIEQLIAESTGKEGRGISAGRAPGLWRRSSVRLSSVGGRQHLRRAAPGPGNSRAAGGAPAPGRPLRPGRAVLPLGTGDGGGWRSPGHQPLQPAGR